MIPTFLIGDYFFVSKYAYGYSRYTWPFSSSPSSGRIWGSEPARGDVVASYCRRIIRPSISSAWWDCPGDRIQMKQGLLHLNGVPVARERLPDFMDEDRAVGVRRPGRGCGAKPSRTASAMRRSIAIDNGFLRQH